MYDAVLIEKIYEHLAREETLKLQALLIRQAEIIRNYRDTEGTSLLGMAVNRNNKALVEWLLEQGVDLWVENNYGQTPLHIAFLLREGEIAAILYYHESKIHDNPMGDRNRKAFSDVFLCPPNPYAMPKEIHEAQISIFNQKMEYLSRSGSRLPEATHDIAVENMEKLKREARSFSDVSTASSASAGSAVRYRGVGVAAEDISMGLKF